MTEEAASPRRKVSKQRTYYQALGVTFEATEDEIKKTYHSVIKTLHPDRRRPGAEAEALEEFHEVQSAYKCLSVPSRRLQYDIRNFGHSSLGQGHGIEDAAAAGAGDDCTKRKDDCTVDVKQKLLDMQREQAAIDVVNMEVSFERILRREKKARGVIIRHALYGDLRLKDARLREFVPGPGQRTITSDDLAGPLIDVTIPVQCLVELHTIVLPGGAATSLADLPGFYNPTPLDSDLELSLYILYEFHGCLHEVIVGDRDALSLPYRRHAVPAGKEPRGPFSPANVAILRDGDGVLRSPRVDTSGASVDDSAGVEAARGSVGPSCSSTSRTLRQAYRAYRLQGLLGSEHDEATPRECATVVVVTGLVLAAVYWLAARRGGRVLKGIPL